MKKKETPKQKVAALKKDLKKGLPKDIGFKVTSIKFPKGIKGKDVNKFMQGLAKAMGADVVKINRFSTFSKQVIKDLKKRPLNTK